MVKTKVIIVGGGISGLFIAYSLLKKGIKDIFVLEKGYLGSGSTGRCASGIRASFTSKEHIILMRRSIELWIKYSRSELGKYGLYYDQGGYVWIATRDETLRMFEELVKLHNSLGVPTRIIDVDELKQKVPSIKVKDIIGAMFDPMAGKSSPFDTIHALYNYLRNANVRVLLHTKVKRVISKGSRVIGVETDGKFIKADIVVVAAGSDSRDILKRLNVNIPITNLPRHALITEAYKHILKPLVIDWDTPGAPYIIQTKDGGFYIGREIEEEPETSLYSQRIDFMAKAVKPLTRFFPWLKNVRVLRYWMGYYITTPDHHPIYGPVTNYENLFLATGFSGHGYMMGPITGEIIAEWIVYGRPLTPEAERLTLDRFRRGELIKEIAIVG